MIESSTRTYAQSDPETHALVDRALSAHYARRRGGEPDRPHSTVEHLDGLLYVRLAGADGYVAVYRVHNDGLLRLMKQPPPQVVLGGTTSP